MLEKKICLVGAFAVGKTSLVKRFITSMFSERYQTTIGVKVDKKSLTIDEREMALILWDLYGEDEFQTLRLSYLRGASGYLLVIDATRRATLEVARALKKTVEDCLGPVPFVVAVNKIDLHSNLEIHDQDLAAMNQQGWMVFRTSARTGEGVEDTFVALARQLWKPPQKSPRPETPVK